MPHSRESRQAAGRVGGLRAAATTDNHKRTQPARDAMLRRYLDQVPAQFTDPDDRMKRALRLRKAYMISLSMKAAEAKRKAASALVDVAITEAELRDAEAEAGDE